MSHYKPGKIPRLLLYGQFKLVNVLQHNRIIVRIVKIAEIRIGFDRFAVAEMIFGTDYKTVFNEKFRKRRVSFGIFTHTVNYLNYALSFACGSP